MPRRPIDAQLLLRQKTIRQIISSDLLAAGQCLYFPHDEQPRLQPHDLPALKDYYQGRTVLPFALSNAGENLQIFWLVVAPDIQAAWNLHVSQLIRAHTEALFRPERLETFRVGSEKLRVLLQRDHLGVNFTIPIL